jgi:hypothetical protein
MNRKTGCIIEGFNHVVGKHCESSSMRDVLEYIGLPFSEAIVFGLDATFGFSFFQAEGESAAAFFVGGKQGTISKESLACRVLGVNISEEQFQSADQCWERSKELLHQNHPLLIRIEMAYLPYVELPEEESFGGHIMSLVGFDDEIAYLYEREFEELVELPIQILKDARSSKKDRWFPPRNTHYILERRTKRPPFSAACKLAIQETVKNMLAVSTNNVGLQGMIKFVKTIPTWKEKLQGDLQGVNQKYSKAGMTLELLYGYMEEFGTGGALFRNLFCEFLEETIQHPDVIVGTHPWNAVEIELVQDQLELMRESARNWTAFAMELKRALKIDRENCLQILDYEKLQNLGDENIRLEEIAFRNLKKLKL